MELQDPLRRVVLHTERELKRLREAGCIYVEANIIEEDDAYVVTIEGFEDEISRKNRKTH